MPNLTQHTDARIENLRKNVDSLTTTVVTHLNKINRLIRELEQPNVK